MGHHTQHRTYIGSNFRTHSMSSFFRPLMPFTSTIFRGFISAIRWPKRYCLNYNSINKSYKKWKSSSYTFFHATNYVGLETTRTTCVHVYGSCFPCIQFSLFFRHLSFIRIETHTNAICMYVRTFDLTDYISSVL